MHKQEIVAKIAAKSDLDETSARKVLGVVLSEISGSLKKGKSVTLTGFGTFIVRRKKKRTMHNIATGKPVVVPAHKAVGFIVGAPLKRLVK